MTIAAAVKNFLHSENLKPTYMDKIKDAVNMKKKN